MEIFVIYRNMWDYSCRLVIYIWKPEVGFVIFLLNGVKNKLASISKHFIIRTNTAVHIPVRTPSLVCA
eukprot:SAG22_NODE_3551_length_1648_cov_1.636540_1_plen_68_part_00